MVFPKRFSSHAPPRSPTRLKRLVPLRHRPSLTIHDQCPFLACVSESLYRVYVLAICFDLDQRQGLVWTLRCCLLRSVPTSASSHWDLNLSWLAGHRTQLRTFSISASFLTFSVRSAMNEWLARLILSERRAARAVCLSELC